MQSSTEPDGVYFLDPGKRDEVESILALHTRFFPIQHDARLRVDIMRHYLLGDLVRDGLVRCVFGRRNGRIVSYLVYTPYPNTYKKDGRRRHRLHLAWLTLRNLGTLPRRFTAYHGMIRRTGAQDGARPDRYPDSTADVLFLATVSPHGKWVPPGGTSRVTVRLFEEMVRDLKTLDIREIFMTVLAGNISSNRFCSSLGCYRIEQTVAADGKAWVHYYDRID